MKSGKRLEQQIKKSADNQGIFCYRLRDNAASFYKSDQLRFTSSNMCDYILFNGSKLLCLELKNHKGKSLPLTTIRGNQLTQLLEASKYNNTRCGLLINFEDVEEAYYLDIRQLDNFIKSEDRKSIPICYLNTNGIKIDMTKLRTNHLYNLKELFERI